jgi:class 3 adenylate cyclase
VTAPHMSFARLRDGINLAYSVFGTGPFLFLPVGGSAATIAEQWDFDEYRAFYDALASRWTVVTYDRRGVGNSGGVAAGGPSQASEEVADCEQLRQTLGADRFTGLAIGSHGGFLIPYAMANPAHVERLVLWNIMMEAPKPYRDYLWPMRRELPRLYHETSLLWRGWLERGSRERLIRLRERHEERRSHDIGASLALGQWDDVPGDSQARHQPLESLTVATDVVFSKDSEIGHVETAAEFGARIPGARLIGLSGAALDPWLGDVDAVAAYFDSLGPAARSRSSSGLSTILFTDVVSSTPLLSQLKDERMRQVMRDHDAVCETAITEHGGRVVKTIGDSFMAEFSVPSAAIGAAIAIQRGVRERFADSDVPVRLRIGINAGEPIALNGDLHGISVVIAKRLEQAADDGGILVSDVVRQAVAGKDFEFEDRGEVELKGFDQPVRAWAVRWDE